MLDFIPVMVLGENFNIIYLMKVTLFINIKRYKPKIFGWITIDLLGVDSFSAT